MPTYDYECKKCGHEFEVVSKRISEPRKKECPECKGPVERKIGTGGGILFKGSGFYTTDYRSASYKKGVEAEKKKDKPAKGSKDGAKSSGSSSPKKKD